MDTRYTYGCRLDDTIVSERTKRCKLYDGILVDLRFCHKLEKPDHAGSDAVAVVQSFQRTIHLSLNTGFLGLEFFLSGYLRLKAHVPYRVEHSIIAEVLSLVESTLNDDNNNNKVVPIVVDVVAITVQGPDESEDEAIARALQAGMEAVLRVVPATKSSIDALNTVTFGDVLQHSNVTECAICLGTLSEGDQVTPMPCSHIYHGNCIVSWLLKSNLCPLCRFAMPS